MAKWSATDVSKVILSCAVLVFAVSALAFALNSTPPADAGTAAVRADGGDYSYAVAFDPDTKTLFTLAWKKSTGQATVYGGKMGVQFTKRDEFPKDPVK